MKSSEKLLYKWQFDALGTSWSIETPDALDEVTRELVQTRIEEYDQTYSRFRDDSLVQHLRTPGEYIFPADVTTLLSIYKKLYDITKGRMTPLIGGLLEQAGYDSGYSLKPQERPTNVPGFDVLGWDREVTLRPTRSVVLDVGAAGKGYLVDLLGEILAGRGVAKYSIDASGDIRTRGVAETIGLEHPLDTSKVIGTANLYSKSLCASAINRRAWDGMHHVFDPITKQPTQSMLATWVIADTTLEADALATALFFVSPLELKKEFLFTHVTIDINGTIDVAPDFDGELFI